MTDPATPAHLRSFPGLSVRRGDDVVPAPDADVAIARTYPAAPHKGAWLDDRRLTLLTAQLRVRVAESVRVIHVLESKHPGDQLYVMGPKPVRGEYVDGSLRGDPSPADPLAPPGLYDGRVLPAPAADYSWDITSYTFDAAGTHTIEWRLGALVSNTLSIEVTP